ncbi:MAG: protein translocase subunit SecDF [Bacteroidales bacterium]|nr:protein translocase subunit SecDF [Bacteroidales bacterium]
MSNKGLVRFLAILLALACLFHLSFSWVTSRVQKKAEEFAKGNPEKESQYLDSIANEPVYPLFGYTYKECLENELNFGLDLKGGMNVILEVSVADVVNALSGHSQDPVYLKAMDLAKQKQKNSQKDFIDLFGEAFEEVAPQGRLASIFATLNLKNKVTKSSTNAEVLDVLRSESEAAIANSFNVLRTRIDRFGVTQPNIQQLSGQTGRILVELPGVKDPERVRNLLKGTANLEFWPTWKATEIWNSVLAADQKIKTLKAAGYDFDKNEAAVVAADSAAAQSADSTASLLGGDDQSLLAEQDSTSANLNAEQWANEHPLFAVLHPLTDRDGNLADGAAVGYVNVKDTAIVNKYLAAKPVKDLLPRDLKFYWCVKAADWDQSGSFYELVAIKYDLKNGVAPLTGDAVTDAREEFDERKGGAAMISMTMNGEGARTWARITKNNLHRQVAIVLDNYVYSFPTVQSEIKGGNSQITGNFSITEAKDLANILKSGKLPAPAQIIEEAVVGPSLGQATISQGMWSFVIAFILVIIYMIVYYRMAGVASAVALICNVFLLFGVLSSLGAVLTLPGIAGIVLTMGMAVDANVIIYERIREELHSGKSLKLAIQDGYSNSYSAILDGNCTTLLTGIILYIFGHGPIQGFATTLVIGVITTLVTAIFVTRLIFDALLDRNKEITFWANWNEFALKNVAIDFIGKKQKFYIISAILIVVSLGSMIFKGFDQGVDFVGGRTYVVKFDNPVATTEVSSRLEAAFGSTPQVKTFGDENQVKIITKYRIDDEGEGVDSEVQTMLYDNLASLYKTQGISRDMFLQGFVLENGNPVISTDNNVANFGFQSSSKVGPTIADDIKTSAMWAIIGSLIVMFIYILIRFKNWQYGLGATAALIHDTIIVLGIFSLFSSILPFSMEIDQSFIAAILTIVGYSINDTVVVFDRVREYIGLHPKTDIKKNMNDAINSTLSRTINTSLTTIFVLLMIFIFGGEVIRGFVFALLLGTIVGTYSSVFIASPITFDFLNKENNKK